MDEEVYISVSGTSGQVALFAGSGLGDIERKANLEFGKNVQEVMAFTRLSEESVLFCVGGYDKAVHCYVVGRKEKQFTFVCSLTGHENAIRALSFNEDSTLLASASQDNSIRLWRLTDEKEEEGYQTKTCFVFVDAHTKSTHNLKLESVLSGHSEAVSSVQWNSSSLLSASFDFTVRVWQMDAQSGLWV